MWNYFEIKSFLLNIINALAFICCLWRTVVCKQLVCFLFCCHRNLVKMTIKLGNRYLGCQLSWPKLSITREMRNNFVILWPAICLFISIISIFCLSFNLYLKIWQEEVTFTVFDNWFYNSYYGFLFILALALLNLQWNHCHYIKWKWIRRISLLCFYIELLGLFIFMLSFNDLYYEYEYDCGLY